MTTQLFHRCKREGGSLLLGALAGLCALIPSPALAQVNTLEADNPRESAKVKFGPLYITPRIQLEDLGIDTNVFNDGSGKRRDFFLTLTPGAKLWLPLAQRGLISGTFGTDLVWYKENASERSIDPEFSVRGEAYFTRFTLWGSASVLSSRQRPNFEIDLRSRRQETGFGGGIDIGVTPTFSVGMSGSASAARFDGDARFRGTFLETTLNSDRKTFTTDAKYRATPLTTITLRADRFEDRFPLSPERGTDNVRVMGGFEFRPRALISGSAFAGVRHLNPVDESRVPEFKGFVSDVALSYTLLGATTFSISHGRDVGYSFEPTQPYFVDTSAGGSIRRALGPHFDAVGSLDRTTYAYRDLLSPTGASGVDAARRVDTTWTYSLSLGYRVGRNGRVGVGISYWQRSSSARPDSDYDGFRLRTSATYGL